MSWLITGTQKTDPDALAYLAEVERADGQALESGVRDAVIAFVTGCKADGIWAAIKASCILAGARTLAGALVPLVGAAPTNFNFVAGDYSRETGLAGNASTKYLRSNRNNNADPQNSKHLSIYATSANTVGSNRGYIGVGILQTGSSHLFTISSAQQISARVNSSTASNFGALSNTGFIGATRSSASSITTRSAGTSGTATSASETPLDQNIAVFGRDLTAQSDARLAFYSIGESLDLALLDARVTTLIQAIDAAI
jgi:hypothetical protein